MNTCIFHLMFLPLYLANMTRRYLGNWVIIFMPKNLWLIHVSGAMLFAAMSKKFQDRSSQLQPIQGCQKTTPVSKGACTCR